MAGSAPKIKTFTVKRANAALPLVRAIVADVARMATDLTERKERLSQILGGRTSLESGNPYDDEMVQVASEIEQDESQLLEYVRELSEIGVELKDARQGLVDFPAEVDGRMVWLCWRLGEPEVAFWHELDAGFTGRRPLEVYPLD